jgi:hypothetical protein
MDTPPSRDRVPSSPTKDDHFRINSESEEARGSNPLKPKRKGGRDERKECLLRRFFADSESNRSKLFRSFRKEETENHNLFSDFVLSVNIYICLNLLEQ